MVFAKLSFAAACFFSTITAFTVEDRQNWVMQRSLELCSEDRNDGTALTPTACVLRTTNFFRCIHFAPNLKWDKTVAQNAQNQADKCDLSYSDSYNSTPPAAENVSVGTLLVTEPQRLSWLYYTQYPYANAQPFYEGRGDPIGDHLTNMIWDASTTMGCGRCIDGELAIYVCQFANPAPQTGLSFGHIQEINKWSPTLDECTDISNDKALLKEATEGEIQPCESKNGCGEHVREPEVEESQ
eukprot:GHVL01017687.1.p1 GENE.GHVL01017687.1~~GHVL01017687.1.p1  ORF type:complete len:241 (+),score=30.20 GHVL01017687.1:66-788(+)